MRCVRIAAIAMMIAFGCAPPAIDPDGGWAADGAGEGGGALDARNVELRADAGPSRYALVGEEVVLDGSASTGAVRYQWSPGGGLPETGAGSDPIARVRYPEPGRYSAVLTAWSEAGTRRTDSVVISVTRAPTFSGARSSSIAIAGDRRIAIVSPDSDELVLARWTEMGALELERRIAVCDEPRTVAVSASALAVACTADAVAEIDAASFAVTIRAMPRGSRPFGIIAREGEWIVTLQGTGEIARLGPSAISRLPAIEDARAIAVMPDRRVAVSRWRSPDARGEIALVALDASRPPEIVPLAFDPQAASDTEVGGVPSYLSEIAISPDGTLAAIPSLQAAIGEGLFRTGGARALTFQTTIRAVVSYLDLGGAIVEDVERRRQLDNRGFANAAVFSARGDYLFVATRGSRSVERIDVLRDQVSGSIQDVGLAPGGLAVSPDDRWLFVDAYLSRELVMIDVSDFTRAPIASARLPIVASEPLSVTVLRGKQLFNDSLDPRLSSDGYVACAHCHLDGMDDHRTWDFTDRGEGLRNTATLLGAPSTGAIHWTANFDEIQDFEHDIRGPFRGTGLMSDTDFHTGTREETLGDPKAGVSTDLDALAAYVATLEAVPPSPYRAPDGTLRPEALRGRAIFESPSTGCTACHAGERTTDSGFTAPGVPLLHDVGTIGAGSGTRLGAVLIGLDTPSLHGVWASAPYLHDGSASSLREVLVDRNRGDLHGTTSHLSTAEIDDLVAYLLSLDGRRD